MPGQIPQGLLGGGHLDVELAGQIGLPLPLGEAARRPAGEGVVDEGVSVEPLPHQGDEQRAGVGLPAVGKHMGDGPVQVVERPQELASHGLSDLSNGNGLHNSPYFPCFLASREAVMMRSHSSG